MSTGKATSKSGRTFSVGSKCCGEPFASAGLSAAVGAVSGVFESSSSAPAAAGGADSLDDPLAAVVFVPSGVFFDAAVDAAVFGGDLAAGCGGVEGVGVALSDGGALVGFGVSLSPATWASARPQTAANTAGAATKRNNKRRSTRECLLRMG